VSAWHKTSQLDFSVRSVPCGSHIAVLVLLMHIHQRFSVWSVIQVLT
jgi:hypothetical protein